MRPFISTCIGCGDVDYRFSIGVHCKGCKRVITAFFWHGTSRADIMRRCLQLGLDFYKLFGNPFSTPSWTGIIKEADIAGGEIVELISKKMMDEIAEAIDREMLRDLLKASNQ